MSFGRNEDEAPLLSMKERIENMKFAKEVHKEVDEIDEIDNQSTDES